jgi:hypothetical protein
MPRKKERRKHIVLGKDFRSDGHTRVTKGEDWIVEGGTKLSHEETSDLVNEFSKRLRKEGHPDASTAAEILRDVLHERRQRN